MCAARHFILDSARVIGRLCLVCTPFVLVSGVFPSVVCEVALAVGLCCRLSSLMRLCQFTFALGGVVVCVLLLLPVKDGWPRLLHLPCVFGLVGWSFESSFHVLCLM